MAFQTKIAPRAARGRHLTIETAVIRINAQTCLIGISGDKICFAGFTDDPAIIKRYYPCADIVEYGGETKGLEQKLQKIWQGDNLMALDIYVEGSAFQIAVWKQLLKIKAGHPIAYRDIARDIHKPKAVRAVGNAVGANPVSIFIPCHRVVHAGGNKMGYAWGVDIKKNLLKAESGF